MKSIKLNHKGFFHHFGLLFFLVIFAIAGAGYVVATNAASKKESTNTYFMYSDGGKYKYVYVWGQGRCGTKTVLYATGSKSNALVFKMPPKDSNGKYQPIKLICTAGENDSYSFDFRISPDESDPADVTSAGEDLESKCIYVHDSGISRTVERENGSCNTDSAKSGNKDKEQDSDNSDGSDEDDGPTATSSGATRPDRTVIFLVRHIAGKELSNKLGIGTSEDRTYIISVQGPGNIINRKPRVFNSKVTDNPIKGVKVKFSSKNRSKKAGCGINGLNRHRDLTKKTNKNGDAVFWRCTNDNFSLTLSNIPTDYVLPGQTDRVSELNMNDGRYIQLERIKQSGFDGVLITITLQQRNRLAPFTQAQRTAFAAAASKYWHNQTLNKTERNLGVIDIDQTTFCKPNQVRYVYTLDTSREFGEADNLASAFPSGARDDKPRRECAVYWNTHPSTYNSLRDDVTACLAFVHEYGHLLGHHLTTQRANGRLRYVYGHSGNPDNIMYPSIQPNNGHLIKETGCHKPGAANQHPH